MILSIKKPFLNHDDETMKLTAINTMSDFDSIQSKNPKVTVFVIDNDVNFV